MNSENYIVVEHDAADFEHVELSTPRADVHDIADAREDRSQLMRDVLSTHYAVSYA